MQFGRGPLHVWKNKELKKVIVKAGANYQFKAEEELKGFDYKEWLKRDEPSDDENDDEGEEVRGLPIGHIHSEIDKKVAAIRLRILRAEHNEEVEAGNESVSNKRCRLVDDEAGEDS